MKNSFAKRLVNAPDDLGGLRRRFRRWRVTSFPAENFDASRADEMLVCDIDNTLTGCPDGARRFGDMSAAAPMSFCVATGRSLIEARRILREWELPQPRVLITSVGSEIYWQTPEGLYARHPVCTCHQRGLAPRRNRKALRPMAG